MLSVLYLILCLTAGLLPARAFAPAYSHDRSLTGQTVQPVAAFIRLPIAFVCGYVLLGWAAYLAAWLARGSADPMRVGSAVALGLGLLLTGAGAAMEFLRFKSAPKALEKPGIGQLLPALLALAFGLFFGWLLFFGSFHENEGLVQIAVNVYSDFSPHIAMIRSFSKGANFPTQYAHFPDGTIRYHFMFVFSVGLLEYLGLPLTWAFNLPSLLCFVCFCLLLYSLAHVLTGSPMAGLLSVVLMFFRSGAAFFLFLLNKPARAGLWDYLTANENFIGVTAHEDWGLFNQNVWANQRHLALGMCFVLIALLYFLPLFERGSKLLKSGFFHWLFTPTAWVPKKSDLLFGLPVGLLLGAAAFWHGSMVISALMILACMGIFSGSRLSYLWAAVPAVLCSTLQSRFFTGGGNPLLLKWAPGFLAASKSFADMAGYLLLLTGILLPLFLWCLFWLCGREQGSVPHKIAAVWFFIACTVPLLQAMTVTTTVDVAVGHKQVMLSCFLCGILPAWFLAGLWGKGKKPFANLPLRLACLVLVFLLTCTGAEDWVTFRNKCGLGTINIDKNEEMTLWIEENTPADSTFITGYITIHPVFTAGRKSYQGWPYYAWSAGYDTDGRDRKLKDTFRPDDSAGFAGRVRALGCDYIVVDRSLTGDERFKAFFESGGEELIAESFPLVFEGWSGRIYQID